MLAGPAGALHPRPVGPTLRKEGAGVDAGRQQLIEGANGPGEAILRDCLGRAVRPLVNDEDLTDPGVEVEEMGELATELPHPDYTD
jgi:hypothetical protein